MKYLVAFAGPMYSGKTTAALAMIEAIAEVSGEDMVRLSFADGIKEVICARHSISRVTLEENKAYYRQEMQELGASKRKEDPYYFIWELIKRFPKGKRGKHCGVVVDDLRYPNEAEVLMSLGFTLVQIVSIPAQGQGSHESEVPLPHNMFDHIIENVKGAESEFCQSIRSLFIDSIWRPEEKASAVRQAP